MDAGTKEQCLKSGHITDSTKVLGIHTTPCLMDTTELVPLDISSTTEASRKWQQLPYLQHFPGKELEHFYFLISIFSILNLGSPSGWWSLSSARVPATRNAGKARIWCFQIPLRKDGHKGGDFPSHMNRFWVLCNLRNV